MPRAARIVIPGLPHHITQRGNNRQDVFFVDDDRRTYLRLLKERSTAHRLQILGYCLMTNHVHILAVPSTETALAQTIGQTHLLYSQYINRLHGRSGHLWQNRFYSCALDDPHLWTALAYAERNPVRAKLVRVPWSYPWSSAKAHTGATDASGLLDLHAWANEWTGTQWKKALRRTEDDAQNGRLRLWTNTGRPLASDRLLSKLERKLGRRLRPLPRGRPPNPKKPNTQNP